MIVTSNRGAPRPAPLSPGRALIALVCPRVTPGAALAPGANSSTWGGHAIEDHPGLLSDFEVSRFAQRRRGASVLEAPNDHR